jgi:hypothetical protein
MTFSHALSSPAISEYHPSLSPIIYYLVALFSSFLTGIIYFSPLSLTCSHFPRPLFLDIIPFSSRWYSRTSSSHFSSSVISGYHPFPSVEPWLNVNQKEWNIPGMGSLSARKSCLSKRKLFEFICPRKFVLMHRIFFRTGRSTQWNGHCPCYFMANGVILLFL